MNQKNKIKQKGFTLIEMLIVIAIVAILASVFLVGFPAFRGGAYDSRRVSDLQKVQSFLEVYYAKYRCYPSSATPGNCAVGAEMPLAWSDLVQALQTAGVTEVVPNDPLPGWTYYYGVSDDRQSYVLGARFSTVDHSSLNEPTEKDGIIYGVDCNDPIFCVQF